MEAGPDLLNEEASGPVGRASGRVLRFARGIIRARETALTAVAILVGVMAGGCVAAMDFATRFLHVALFGTPADGRLSTMDHIAPWLTIAVPALGGLALGLFGMAMERAGRKGFVDPIEANALHGGRMSVVDSLIVAVQTVWSSGVGASVGLEAGYTQISSGLASRLGQVLHIRRSDLRVLVGCGAAGGIAAAFHAPLTGAFYGFELIIGVYAIPAAAPVLGAALAGFLTVRVLGVEAYPIEIPHVAALTFADYAPFVLFGLVAGIVAIAIMRLVTLTERVIAASHLPKPLRPMAGGIAVGCLALASPQVLSSGHGALHMDITTALTLSVGLVLALKILAASISIGSGFRGGLFFTSLFIGALLGKVLWGVTHEVAPGLGLDPVVASVVGMSALAVGVVGGPLTMSFLALESTGDLGITGLVLTACVVTSLFVREVFGYSFSTWRLHLRGETIRGAHDVGWMRQLTVKAMMREDVKTFPAAQSIAAFREAFPLGAGQRVILVDGDGRQDGRHAGIVRVADAYAASADPGAPALSIARYRDHVLVPAMNVQDAARAFEAAEAEELAVVDDPSTRRVIGLLTEAHTFRRYAEELDKVRRGLAGEAY